MVLKYFNFIAVDFSQRYEFLNKNLDIQDAERIQIAHHNNSKISNSTLIKDMFYEKINNPLQTQCKILKKVGGSWRSNSCGFVNGEKMVCMDVIYEALKNDSCLIYSFGLSDNWDFEIAMAELGKSNNTGAKDRGQGTWARLEGKTRGQGWGMAGARLRHGWEPCRA